MEGENVFRRVLLLYWYCSATYCTLGTLVLSASYSRPQPILFSINASAAHLDAFEFTLRAEIAAAAEVRTTRIAMVSSKAAPASSAVTMVRFQVHPLPARRRQRQRRQLNGMDDTLAVVIDNLVTQSADPESYMRTHGSFLRRVVDREGALNVVVVTAEASTGSGAAAGATGEIESVDPFVPLDQQSSAPGDSGESDSGESTSHGGIAGIAVASSFLGLGIIVGAVWYGVHRTKAGAAFKSGRASSKRETMKIQLTESEKAEMGMHTNPAHLRTQSSAKVEEGVQIIKAAVAQDEARNYAGAINLYQSGCDKFMAAMKLERNATFKFELAKKCDRYLVRIKQLKEYTSNGGAGGGGGAGAGGRGRMAAGRGGMASAPVVATRAPKLVRAPVA